MLELAIEEGIDPRDMLYRLINHPSGAMWSLYSSYRSGGGPTSRASATGNCSKGGWSGSASPRAALSRPRPNGLADQK
jgi:hypothetical protein